jgi:sporulation protein YabP
MENPTTKSNLVLNNRNELNITGIKKVKSTEPNSVIANLDNGNIIISGSNLSVSRLDIKEGVLELNGIIDSIKYSSQTAKSFSLKNMFK